MSKLNAIILVVTLKSTSETSNILILSQFLVKHFADYDIEYEIITLSDYNIKPGTYTTPYIGFLAPKHIIHHIIGSRVLIWIRTVKIS